MKGNGTEAARVAKQENTELGLTEARRVREHGLEYRLEVAGRARDDLQHLGGRRLLLQCFAELARPRLHLVKQLHVPDRDHRLIGERLHQLDLPAGEWSHLAPRAADDADRVAILESEPP